MWLSMRKSPPRLSHGSREIVRSTKNQSQTLLLKEKKINDETLYFVFYKIKQYLNIYESNFVECNLFLTIHFFFKSKFC